MIELLQTIQNHNTLMEKEFIEAGAALEHDRWARWQKWCHKILRENCPSPELEKVLERWDRQINTPYAELSEQEKESDRKETRNYLPLLLANNEKLAELVAIKAKEEARKEIHEWVKEKQSFFLQGTSGTTDSSFYAKAVITTLNDFLAFLSDNKK